MTLHPIAVVDRVLEEYRSYLSTEFRARDEKLRQALEKALDEPGFLAQDPFFQAHRPFKAGRPWREFGLDSALAKAMEARSDSKTAYLHQSDAITHLLSEEAGPLVVTTGTGSGKTECFLLPAIQNAIEDSTRFKKSGLTAILVYPMNALANDQEERIRSYLEDSGHTHVTVARYDRSTKHAERERLRNNPPHILLTNYMMLEYLLVRPADREALFANHRCRFIVLDEVHTYRGSLGANIALLFRRLLAHLRHAQQDWQADDGSDQQRFPTPIPIATSATIKSIDEMDRSEEEIRRLRDEAVQEFVSRLTGYQPTAFKILGEEIQDLHPPAEAGWPPSPPEVQAPHWREPEGLPKTVAALAGMPLNSELGATVRRAAIFWKLGELLARRPMSLSQIVGSILAEVPERQGADREAVRCEVEAALVAGTSLPDDMPGALRLRTHRFIRGGWRFTRCVDPDCGRLHPMGEERCSCGTVTAPLYLCRSCGAHTLRFRDQDDDPEAKPLVPNDSRINDGEWVLYDRSAAADGDDDDELVGVEKQMKKRPVLRGSFDPDTCSFVADETTYRVPAVLAPGRNRCLFCGGTAGSHSVLTPVGLGTSAAVRVISEGLVEGLADQHGLMERDDDKERLLIFSDSRQDAAHQARFISYAGRYDRMRRRLVRLLQDKDGGYSIDKAVQALMVEGVQRRDNPQAEGYKDADYLPQAARENAEAWEEAPLLDDLSIGASYRATVFNLGLVGVRYEHLDRFVSEQGVELASDLGLSTGQMAHLARCLLDELRRRGALSRPILCYHPGAEGCPPEFRFSADWERRLKNPAGYACSPQADPVSFLDASEAPPGISLLNVWRRPKAGGRGPALERKFKHLMAAMGGDDPTEERLLELLRFLTDGPRFLVGTKLFGHRKSMTLLQVNQEVVRLELLDASDRYRCNICNVRMPWSQDGAPCPGCHGALRSWPESEVVQSRYVERILKGNLQPLVAAEHTAQVTGDERIELEGKFKGPATRSPLNVLACSPTLEMGIDVGGLDAVVMRNVPPRPDNYAQRGGRAGRRSRVGIVLGYARNTPHDGYFYDKPGEMIAGEVPAPGIGLGNRDVVLRHLHAIAFGAAEPGLSGKMGDYISIRGELRSEKVDELIDAVAQQSRHAVELALDAWGPDILDVAGLATKESLVAALEALSDQTRDVFDRVRRQIIELEENIKRWMDLGKGDRAAVNAMELKRRLLGIRSDDNSADREADDRSSGHPMRRFAEFGVLPGYEFPSEPSTLRLWRDRNEDEAITVERRFGIAQYQPDARVHARGHRWRVVGLDLASPWNPKTPDPTWIYTRCKQCDLRYGAQEHVRCPRCESDETIGNGLPGHEFGGFLAIRDDTPVLEEEDRFAIGSLVQCHPQRNGLVKQRYELPTGWGAQLRTGEEVRWVNEWRPPSEMDKKLGRPYLHDAGRGFYLCPSCGRVLHWPDDEPSKKKGRKKAAKGKGPDKFGHTADCDRIGQPPEPRAITTKSEATTLRIVVQLPHDFKEEEYARWGYSLGYALRTGIRHLYMLDGPEIEFALEPMWEARDGDQKRRHGALTFVDSAVGGSGFLDRAAAELHLVAKRTIEHLDHPKCETACYRCLKAYNNQRHHEHLSWPHVMPDIEQLADLPPVALPPELGDSQDPKPWLEAFDAGVGSPLELQFLKLFEQEGLALEKQVPVAANEGEKPISTADFAIADKRVAIYIDGAAFHRGDRLRRDRYIRTRLRAESSAWTVLEYRRTDLSRGHEIIDEIRAAAGP